MRGGPVTNQLIKLHLPLYLAFLFQGYNRRTAWDIAIDPTVLEPPRRFYTLDDWFRLKVATSPPAGLDLLAEHCFAPRLSSRIWRGEEVILEE